MLTLEASATPFAFQALQRLPTSTVARAADSVLLPCADWLLSRMLRWTRLSQRRGASHALPPTGAEESDEDLPPAHVTSTPSRGVRGWTVSLLRAIAVQSQLHLQSPAVLSSPASSSSSSSVVLSVLHRSFVLLAQHATRSEVERDIVGTCMQVSPRTFQAKS